MPESLIPIPQRVAEKSYFTEAEYERLYQYSLEHPEEFWAEKAREILTWDQPFTQVLDYNFERAEFKWFADGQLNASVNCIDRHCDAGLASKTAIIWEGNEPGESRKVSYGELFEMVVRLATGLRNLGAKRGDRIAIYMPMVPEVAAAMLACARIGAMHSVIFAGFSAESVRDRLIDSECAFILTADFGRRGAKSFPLKEVVDKASEGLSFIKNIIVYQRTADPVPMTAERDLLFDQVMDNGGENGEPERMNSEDPLFILYTSGSTGKPKGALHTHAGYLLFAAITHRYVFDCGPEDIYFCAADVGWITGHSYIVYGPLANGATTVMFESTPLYPDAGRYWQVIEKLRVNIFYTAPTAIRALQKEGDGWVKSYDRSSLRILGSVGEPINEDAWQWYYGVVGDEQCAVVDTWWQTETGGIMIAPLPGAVRPRPGFATRPFFGVRPCIVDEEGNELQGNSVEGKLCMTFPWPGQMRTVYGDHQRFIDTYYSKYPGKYFTGDGCIRDEHGYYRITGRVDDVLNVSGHRLGTAEIESALIHSGEVVEAAVVGYPHPIKGTGVYAFCIPPGPVKMAGSDAEARKSAVAAVRAGIGAFAAPDVVCFVPSLPKTRSGKIMRRILRKIAAGDYADFGDISTLAEPAVVDEIVQRAKSVQ